MAKVSPVSIKYMIHADFLAEGALEKPDVIGALFGQTEGLLGSDLEMRELQKEGKIGRIEVELTRKDKRTTGKIQIPTALDQSETTLLAAAIETIERIGPCDSQIDIVQIEDVRGSKRDYIIERAKKLMKELSGGTDSRQISNEIKDSRRTSEITTYGSEKLPCGDLSGKEIVVVEGRADVVNLLKHGVDNVVGMNGTKLPDGIKELGKTKEITLFIDGDRGGKLIAKNVCDNANVKYIAVAPEGTEVEELTNKEVLMNLRKKVPAADFFRMGNSYRREVPRKEYPKTEEKPASPEKERPEREAKAESFELSDKLKEELKEISKKNSGSGKAILLDKDLKEIKKTSVRGLNIVIQKAMKKPSVLVIDGIVIKSVISAAEDAGVQVIVAKNFGSTDTNIELLSL